MRIGYSLVYRLITYPRVRNLSACEPSAAEVASDLGADVGVGCCGRPSSDRVGVPVDPVEEPPRISHAIPRRVS